MIAARACALARAASIASGSARAEPTAARYPGDGSTTNTGRSTLASGVAAAASAGRWNARGIGERLRSGCGWPASARPSGRAEALDVVVHHGFEVLAAELPVADRRQAQPALRVQGRDDGLLLGGGQGFGFASGAGGAQPGRPDQAPVVVDVVAEVVGHVCLRSLVSGPGPPGTPPTAGSRGRNRRPAPPPCRSARPLPGCPPRCRSRPGSRRRA